MPGYEAGWEAGREELRSHYQPVPPDPHYVFVEKPSKDGGLNRGDDVQVRRNGIFLSYQNAWGALAFIALLIWWGRGQFADVQYEIKDLRSLVTQFPLQITQAVDRAVRTVADGYNLRLSKVENDITSLKADLQVKPMSRYTRADHDNWCLKTEQLNAKIGWRCSELPIQGGVRSYEIRPQNYYPAPTQPIPQTWDTQNVPPGKPLKEANSQ